MTERLSDREEQRLVASVRSAISQTNTGVDPNAALAKAASAQNYNHEFLGRMVEMYNTSRTLAHLKNASGQARAADFPLAAVDKVAAIMFPCVNSHTDLLDGVGEMGTAKAAMALALDKPALEKAAAYVPDIAAKVERVQDMAAGILRDISDLKTKRAGLELIRETHLRKAAEYFRKPGHKPFEDVDVCMNSMFGKAGSLAMDVVWMALGAGQRLEKRAQAVSTYPRLADPHATPVSDVISFMETSKEMAKVSHEINSLQLGHAELVDGLKERLANFHKRADLVGGAIGGLMFDALKGSSATAGQGSAAGQKALSDAVAAATDPAHENIIKSIETESMLQDLIANDPVIGKYAPADVVDTFNEISKLAPQSATQPIVLRGYLRRMLESSPSVAGKTLEGFEAGQLADIEKKLQPDPKLLMGIVEPKFSTGS